MTADPPLLLLFDFDGTIANTIDTGVGIFNEIAPEYGMTPISREEAQELRRLNIRAALSHLGISKVKAIKIATRIRREIHERMDEVDVIAGMPEALEALFAQGYRLAILSSNSTENIGEFIARYGLAHCFEFIEGSVSLFGKSKRIKQVLKKGRIDRRDVIYVGDESRDMEAARKSRVATVAVCWGANRREALVAEGPTYCIDHPSALAGCIAAFDGERRR